MKKLFFAALALAAMVGCNDSFNEIEKTPTSGDSALLKVNIKSAGDLTRAGVPSDYKDGSDAENAVEKVDFYFFDAQGSAYAVNGVAGGDNFITYKPNFAAENDKTYIEEISDVVLVIKGAKQQLPTQVVAIVNGPVATTKNKAQLEAEVLTSLYDKDGNFVMSNSVYMDGTVKITATQILPENIFTTTVGDVEAPGTLELEGVNPIDIYVERVAAAVEVKIKEGNMYDTGVKYNAGEGNIYAKVLGWGVTNNTAEANLVKAIDAAWDATTLGFQWNNAPFFRSYWAATTAIPAHNLTFNALKAHNGTVDYYFENTKPAAEENSVVAGEGNQTPQLLVAAQLVDKDGNAISLGEWYGVQYTIEDLKTVMVNTVASKLFVKNGETYVSVNKDDVEFYQMPDTTADNRYEVKMRAKEGIAYYDAAGVAADANAILGAVSPAKMYTTGYTYYYTNINHYGTTTGVVRNHWYEVSLKSITGLGTPVYNPDHYIIPEKPEADEPAHLAAQINVLAWSLVQNDVELN